MNKSFHFTDFTGETQFAEHVPERTSSNFYNEHYKVDGKAIHHRVVEGLVQSGRWKKVDEKAKTTLPEKFEFKSVHDYITYTAQLVGDGYLVTWPGTKLTGVSYSVGEVERVLENGSWKILSAAEQPKTERERQLELAIDHHKLSIAHHELMITKYEKELANVA